MNEQHALVNVHQMGRSIFDPVWAEVEHANQRCELIHILQGTVRVETPTYVINGEAGDTLLTPSGTLHRDVFPRGTVYEVYLLHVDWSQEQQMIDRYSPPLLAQAATTARTVFADAFDRLYNEFINDQPFHQDLVHILAAEILYKLCRYAELLNNDEACAHAGPQQVQRNIMEETRQLIDRMLTQAISLDDLAERLQVSPYHLSRTFSREHGFTLSQYITHRRMEAAAVLLVTTEQSIKDIAASVGYPDSHYFSRVFREHFSQAPSVYRQRSH